MYSQIYFLNLLQSESSTAALFEISTQLVSALVNHPGSVGSNGPSHVLQ